MTKSRAPSGSVEDARPIFEANKVALAQRIKQMDIELDAVEHQRGGRLLATIPNLPHESVPIGQGSADNVVVRGMGRTACVRFRGRPHWDLGPNLASSIRTWDQVGRRAIYRPAGRRRATRARAHQLHARPARPRARLHRGAAALLVNASNAGTAPASCRNSSRIYSSLLAIRFCLIPTAEVPVTNLYRDEIIEGGCSPLKLHRLHTVLSQRGRLARERRTRNHPPASVPESRARQIHHAGQSYDELEKPDRTCGNGAAASQLHYRTAALSTGDLGFSAAKTYDIEVWLPSQQTYREISSCSNCESFQARRANIKYRPQGTGKVDLGAYVERIGLAVGRTLDCDPRKLPAEG